MGTKHTQSKSSLLSNYIILKQPLQFLWLLHRIQGGPLYVASRIPCGQKGQPEGQRAGRGLPGQMPRLDAAGPQLGKEAAALAHVPVQAMGFGRVSGHSGLGAMRTTCFPAPLFHPTAGSSALPTLSLQDLCLQISPFSLPCDITECRQWRSCHVILRRHSALVSQRL